MFPRRVTQQQDLGRDSHLPQPHRHGRCRPHRVAVGLYVRRHQHMMTPRQRRDHLLIGIRHAPEHTNTRRRRIIPAMSDLPIHFFTIVLNGQPFIRYHLDL